MSNIDIGNFKGLDLRTNDFNKPHNASSDLMNIELDSDASLKKRYGHELHLSLPTNTIKLVRYKELNELIAIASDGLYRVTTGAPELIKNSFDYIDINDPDTVEVNGILYITGIGHKNSLPKKYSSFGLIKYDGYYVYRAGVDKPIASSYSSGGTYDHRVAIKYYDYQMNAHFSDYDEKTENTFTSVSVFMDYNYTYLKYGIINPAYSTFSLSGSSLTIPVLSSPSHSYSAGDKILIVSEDGVGIRVTVDSTTSTSITLNGTDVENELARINQSTFDIVHQVEGYRVSYYQWRSDTGLNQYFLLRNAPILYNTGINPTYPQAPFDFDLPDPIYRTMEEDYDTIIVKGLPPNSKYITYYGGSLVLGGEDSVISGDNQYPVVKSTIKWSDVSRGSSIESFAPLDFEIIGKTSDGEITGIFGGPNFLGVLKSEKVFTIDGLLTNKSYRIRDSLTPGVGCLNHESIAELSGGGIFISKRGIYWMTGGEPNEASDLIEPLFTKNPYDLNFSGAKSISDTMTEKILFYIPYNSGVSGLVVVYDYYHREWFLWSGMDCSGGLCFFNDEIYFANSEGIFKMNTSYSDAGISIPAYYKSSWINNGEPSIRKKYINSTIYSFSGERFTCTVQHQEDWSSENITNHDLLFDGERKFEEVNMNQNFCNSLRYALANDKLNEGLSINGITVEYEAPQSKMKVR